MKKVLSLMFGGKKRKVAAGILTVALASTTAFAAWTVFTATGGGAGRVGALVAPTIIAGETTSAGDLYPSATQTPTGGLRLSIQNPNQSGLYLKSLTASASGVTGGTAQCDFSVRGTGGSPQPNSPAANVGWAGMGTFYSSTGVAAGTKAFTGLSIAVPASVTSQVVIPNAMYATDVLPTDCQGVAFSGLSVTNATFSTAP